MGAQVDELRAWGGYGTASRLGGANRCIHGFSLEGPEPVRTPAGRAIGLAPTIHTTQADGCTTSASRSVKSGNRPGDKARVGAILRT